MTKDEALKLALEALGWTDEWRPQGLKEEAITAIKEALAQPEPNYKKALEVWLDKTEWVQETVKPHELGMHRADVLKQRIEATLAQPEQEPMTKAGELRAIKTELWKQTEQDGECKYCTDGCPACDARKLPEQEPVAWLHRFIEGGISIGLKPLDLERHPERWEPLYTEPRPCLTCEALARTVMLDQTSHDTQRTWVGLTLGEQGDLYSEYSENPALLYRAIEAKLKEKNT